MKHYTMKVYGGVDVYLHIFLTSALAGGEWSASRTSCFTFGEGSPQYPLDMRLGGPQSRSGGCGDEKILHPTGTQTSTFSVVQPIASRYTYYTIPAPLSVLLSTKFMTHGRATELCGLNCTVFFISILLKCCMCKGGSYEG
jgi:hypothetical protein